MTSIDQDTVDGLANMVRGRRRPRAPAKTIGQTGGLWARNVPCSRCDGTVPVILRSLVGDDRCICAKCSVSVQGRVSDIVSREMRLSRRLSRVGLDRQREIVAALGITSVTQNPAIRHDQRWARALQACAALRATAEPGQLLVLSGPSQVGKSTCAGGTAYQTHGRYCSSDTWRDVRRWWDPREAEWLMDHAGIVVLDEVCMISSNGKTSDSSQEQKTISMLVRGRRDRQRSTIITTNATESEWLDSYGTAAEAIWARARDLTGEVVGAGFVDCSPRART